MQKAADVDISAPCSPRSYADNHLYGPSIPSSASSSSTSVFSVDVISSQSSQSSGSTSSSSSILENESADSYFSQIQHQLPHNTEAAPDSFNTVVNGARQEPTRLQGRSDAVPAELRRNPRRTQRLSPSNDPNGCHTTCHPRQPPSLIRQSDRKYNFVDSLVGKLEKLFHWNDSMLTSVLQDTTTQMIGTIWPLSASSCGQDVSRGFSPPNLFNLRTFVQEVLRRSRTSYSTLQVALYYLVLIKPSVPRHDFTMEQPKDSPPCFAIQCGRRIFLAALILASKYLQDRNFSTRAWSKISGLKTSEINRNEAAFLSAIDWKLHMSERLFERWTDIVFKYSLSAQTSTSPRSAPTSPSLWQSIVPRLTPDLDEPELGPFLSPVDSGYSSPTFEMYSPPLSAQTSPPSWSEYNESTTPNEYTIPLVLEPTPQATVVGDPTLPPLPRLNPLPTPAMTPRTGPFCTLAASALSGLPRRPSMCSAVAQINRASLARSTLDNVQQWRPRLPQPVPNSARLTSLAQSASSMSSPESMISDTSSQSSRSSRSSSISSVTTSNCALSLVLPATKATSQYATRQRTGLEENQQPTILTFPSDDSSPEASLSSPENPAGSDNDYFVKPPLPQPTFFTNPFTSSPVPRSASSQVAAIALRELALNRPRTFQSTLKRGRSPSVDISVQNSVRQLLRPHGPGNISQDKCALESVVLKDTNAASSFVLGNPKLDLTAQRTVSMRKTDVPRKRQCREEAARFDHLLQERTSSGRRPGMWEGII